LSAVTHHISRITRLNNELSFIKTINEEESMNNISLSGTVVRRRVSPDQTTVYRVLIPRQPGMLPNPDGKNFDAIDVCFPQAVGRAPSWQQGDQVEVTGFLQQRDTRENLVHLLRRAEGLGDAERNELAANAQGFVQQAKVEVVATQWRFVGRRENAQSN